MSIKDNEKNCAGRVGRISRDSRSAVAELGLSTSSLSRKLAGHGSAVRFSRASKAVFAIPYFVRVGRIELPSTDWQPVVLPLNHTRKFAKIIIF